MINGTHSIIYSRNTEADRAFFRDVLELPHVDVGAGWLIYGLPPSEVAFHPAMGEPHHEFYLMCEDIHAFIASMKEHRVACDPVSNQGWGLLTQITLPGGGKLGVYEPRHARPKFPGAKVAKKKKAAKKNAVKKKPVKKKPAKKKKR